MAAQAVEGLSFPEEKKRYIVEVLDPVLEQMVQEVLLETPPSVTDHMIRWLQKRTGAPMNQALMGTREKNVRLKRELERMRDSLNNAATAASAKRASMIEEESDEDSDEDDDAPDEPAPPPASTRKPRASVSAEAYGDWNKARSFTPPVYPKSQEQTARLRKVLSQSFMFANLEEKELTVVLLAMVERTFPAGTRIITEGDDGDVLYVIERGNPVCKKFLNGQNQIVKRCQAGDVFGELALLYNNPRAATVEAVDDCKCWELDRETFSHIVKDAATKQSQLRERFLANVSLFASLSQHERAQISDCLRLERYRMGDSVVSEGEAGNVFYIVEEGSLDAVKGGRTVMEYGSGQYFGELALLKNQPRAASVVVKSDSAKLLSLDRKSFTKLLGPLQAIMQRSAEQYK